MFGKKTKRIKELEEIVEEQHADYVELFNDCSKLQNENTNLRLDNGRLRNEVGRLQSQVQRVGLVRNAKGQMERLK